MPKKLYNISMSEQERQVLKKIVSNGKSSAKAVLRANILLNSDSSDGRIPVKARELASLLSTSTTTVQNVRRGYSNSNMEETIKRKKRETPPVAPKADGVFGTIDCFSVSAATKGLCKVEFTITCR